MIDIHAHILPGVDDGAETWDDSIELLRQGYEDGIRGVVCTSHVVDVLDTDFEAELIKKYHALQKRVIESGMVMDVWLASEVHCLAAIDLNARPATFNANGKYLLLEFPMGYVPQNADDRMFELQLEGIQVILAHPERYASIVREPAAANKYSERGILFQVNAGSITGRFGKRVRQVALQLIEHDMVHFVASDAHHVQRRPMRMSNARDQVAKRFGEQTAVALFEQNPLRAVRGEPILVTNPRPIKKRNGVFGFLKN